MRFRGTSVAIGIKGREIQVRWHGQIIHACPASAKLMAKLTHQPRYAKRWLARHAEDSLRAAMLAERL